jgi:signal transduction histidine kinase
MHSLIITHIFYGVALVFLGLLAQISVGWAVSLLDSMRKRQLEERCGELAAANCRLCETIEMLEAEREGRCREEEMRALAVARGLVQELNNALAIIRGHAELARHETDLASIRSDLAVIETTIDRTAGLTRSLLDFAISPPATASNGTFRSLTLESGDCTISSMGVDRARYALSTP